MNPYSPTIIFQFIVQEGHNGPITSRQREWNTLSIQMNGCLAHLFICTVRDITAIKSRCFKTIYMFYNWFLMLSNINKSRLLMFSHWNIIMILIYHTGRFHCSASEDKNPSILVWCIFQHFSGESKELYGTDLLMAQIPN